MKIFGEAILVISGQGRMMYQYCKPKSEGTIFSKRSKPQGTDRAPHDAAAIILWQLNQSYEVDVPNQTMTVVQTNDARQQIDGESFAFGDCGCLE